MQLATQYLSPRSADAAIFTHRRGITPPGTQYRKVARVLRNPDGTADHCVVVFVQNRLGYVTGAL